MAHTHAYVLREAKCRHATVFMVDAPEARKENSREIAKRLREGMTVERMTLNAARKLMGISFDEHARKGECLGRKKKVTA